MKKKVFEEVMFASEEKAKSKSKYLVYDEIGEMILDKSKREVTFKGKKNHLCIKQIKNVQFKRQNYAVYSIVKICFGLSFLLLLQGNSVLYVLVVLIPGVALGLVAYFATYWCQVTYYDDKGGEHQVYLADGGYFGYSGIFGGTKKMYREIKSMIPDNQV